MAGGPGKIDEYNRSISEAKRKENARRAGSAPKRRNAKTIREIAKIINNAPAQAQARDSLAKLGLKDKDMTNAALIAAAVFRAAFEGDMRAVEKWERYIGQADVIGDEGSGMLPELIDGLREPSEPNDLYSKAAGADEAMADESLEKD